MSKAKSRTKTVANTAFLLWGGHGRKIHIWIWKKMQEADGGELKSALVLPHVTTSAPLTSAVMISSNNASVKPGTHFWGSTWEPCEIPPFNTLQWLVNNRALVINGNTHFTAKHPMARTESIVSPAMSPGSLLCSSCGERYLTPQKVLLEDEIHFNSHVEEILHEISHLPIKKQQGSNLRWFHPRNLKANFNLQRFLLSFPENLDTYFYLEALPAS